MTTTAPARMPRSDAQRNRRRVLEAAAAVFAVRGGAATLNDVARAAGVGVGTVYRKFSDKDAMLDALLADKIDLLVRVAERAAGVDDPGEAFRELMAGVIEARATDRGLDAVLSAPGLGQRFTAELGVRFVPIVERLVARAIDAGELREGFTGQEVCLLGFMVGKVADITRESDPDLWRRYAQLLIDGTRVAAAAEPLRPVPLPFDRMAAALGRSA